MELLSEALAGAAALGLCVWWGWSVWIAYKRSPVFGLACLLVPMVILYTIVTEPKLMWRPALVLLASLGAAIGAVQVQKG